MPTQPVKAIPISYFRSHTKTCLRDVYHDGKHLVLTQHGKLRACVISMHDTRVLWQLQSRPIHEMQERLEKTYAAWLRAKQLDEGWEGTELDTHRWTHWSGFEKM